MDVGVSGVAGLHGGQIALDDFFFLGQLFELVDGHSDIEAVVDGRLPVPALVGQLRKPGSKFPGAVLPGRGMLGYQGFDLFADVADAPHGLEAASEGFQDRPFDDLLGHQIPFAGRVALGDEPAAGVVEVGEAALLLAAQLLDAVKAMAACALDEAREVVGGFHRVPALERGVAFEAFLLGFIKELLRNQSLEAVLLVCHYPVFGGVLPERSAVGRLVRRRGPLLDGMVFREIADVPDVGPVVDRVHQDAPNGAHRPEPAARARDAFGVKVLDDGPDALLALDIRGEYLPHDGHAVRSARDQRGTGSLFLLRLHTVAVDLDVAVGQHLVVGPAPQASDAVKLLARAVDHHAVEAVGGGPAGVKAGLRERHKAADGVGREVDEVLASLGILNGAGDEVQELVAGLLHALDEVDTFAGLLYLPLDAEAIERIGRAGEPIALPEVDVGYVPARVADGQELLEAGPGQDAARDALVLAPGLALHEFHAIAVGGGADGFLLFVDRAFLTVRRNPDAADAQSQPRVHHGPPCATGASSPDTEP